MDSEVSFTSPQLAHLVGIDARVPSQWAERGYFSPAVREAEGRGSKRLWSQSDVVHAAVLAFLSPHLSVGTLRRLGRFVEANPEALSPEVTWHIPLGAEDGVVVRVMRGEVEVSRATVKGLTRSDGTAVDGELLASGIPDGPPLEEAPVVITVRIGLLHDRIRARTPQTSS